MIGRTPGNIVAIKTLKDGVIADFDINQTMIKRFIQKITPKSAFFTPRIVACYPSGVTGVEKRAIDDAANQVGAIKMDLGSAFKTDNQEKSKEIKGMDLISGLPKTIVVTEAQIRDALAEPVAAIIDAIKRTLEKTPPELSSDIMEKGIMLAGGGALLDGLDILISNKTHMPVHIAESPLDCVALGSGKSLEFFDKISKRRW